MIFLILKRKKSWICSRSFIVELRENLTPINTSKKLCKNDGTSKIDEQFFRSIVRSLMYLIHIRPNIMFFVSMISRFRHCLTSDHLRVSKRILSYICRTMDLRIHCHKV